MSLTEYFRIVRRWGWILVLVALLTAGSAYIFSKTQTPIYKSTVYVGVQPSRPDLGLTTSAKTLLRYYVSVIDTETYAQKVIDSLQLDRKPADLLSTVTIASDDSRFVIQIDVTNPDGNVANNIAQKWADAFVAWRVDQNAKVAITDKVDATILDAPKYALFRPITKVNTLAGGILGLLLGGVIVFAIEYLQAGVLRSPQDVERVLDLSVLGAIPPAETGSQGARGRAARAG